MADDAKPGEMPNVTTPPSETPVTPPQAASPLELQAELEKVRSALREANKEAAARRKRLEELEASEVKRKESELSEMEKLTKRLADTEAKLKAKERADLQRQVAEKIGLPSVFAARLTGETLEDLEADAKTLLAALPKTPELPKINPTNPSGAEQGETSAQRLAQIHGQGADIFSPDAMRKLGGGVYQSSKTE